MAVPACPEPARGSGWGAEGAARYVQHRQGKARFTGHRSEILKFWKCKQRSWEDHRSVPGFQRPGLTLVTALLWMLFFLQTVPKIWGLPELLAEEAECFMTPGRAAAAGSSLVPGSRCPHASCRRSGWLPSPALFPALALAISGSRAVSWGRSFVWRAVR